MANNGGYLDCSTAGGSTANTPSTNTPTTIPTNAPPVPGIGGLSPPGFGTVPNYDNSGASPLLSLLLSTCIGFLLVLI